MQDISPHSLPHALVRLFRLVNRAHNRALAAHRLSAEQAHLLTVLWRFGPMTVGELQRILALSSGTLTGAIDRMEADGLVRRAPSPTDGRAFVLEPTAAANRKRRGVEATLDAVETKCFRALLEPDRRRLLLLLEAASADLEAELDRRRPRG